MNELYFVRATTPSYTMAFYDEDDQETQIDVSGYKDIRITLRQFESTVLRKSTKEGTATLNADGTVSFSLTQEETLRFQPGTVIMQPHLLDSENGAYADKDPIKVKVYEIQDGGTI